MSHIYSIGIQEQYENYIQSLNQKHINFHSPRLNSAKYSKNLKTPEKNKAEQEKEKKREALIKILNLKKKSIEEKQNNGNLNSIFLTPVKNFSRCKTPNLIEKNSLTLKSRNTIDTLALAEMKKSITKEIEQIKNNLDTSFKNSIKNNSFLSPGLCKTPIQRSSDKNQNKINNLIEKLKNNKKLSLTPGKQNTNKIYIKPKLQEKRKSDIVKKMTFKSYAMVSNTGKSATSETKINQDQIEAIPEFTYSTYSSAFFVFDGHGENGHLVSDFLKKNLPEMIQSTSKDQKNYKKFFSSNQELLEDCFRRVNRKLFKQNINTNLSGSTCCSVIITEDKIICANVGDSRAILIRYENSNENDWSYHLLSRDHKPCESDEERRILNSNGRVESYRTKDNQFLGPKRVWRKDENTPGLAMSRSFGDKVASSLGVIAVPEIFEWNISSQDKIIIIASDGLWEYVGSYDCVEIIKEYFLKNQPQQAAEALLKEAIKQWEENDVHIDDISIIVVFI